jgi:hypothetical protein
MELKSYYLNLSVSYKTERRQFIVSVMCIALTKIVQNMFLLMAVTVIIDVKTLEARNNNSTWQNT